MDLKRKPHKTFHRDKSNNSLLPMTTCRIQKRFSRCVNVLLSVYTKHRCKWYRSRRARYTVITLFTIQATNMNWFRLSLFAFGLVFSRFAVRPYSQQQPWEMDNNISYRRVHIMWPYVCIDGLPTHNPHDLSHRRLIHLQGNGTTGQLVY